MLALDRNEAKHTRELFDLLSMIRDIATMKGVAWKYGDVIDEVFSEGWMITATHRFLTKDSTPLAFSQGSFAFEVNPTRTIQIVRNGRGTEALRFKWAEWCPTLFGKTFEIEQPVVELRDYLIAEDGKPVEDLVLRKGVRSKLSVFGDESSTMRIFSEADS